MREREREKKWHKRERVRSKIISEGENDCDGEFTVEDYFLIFCLLLSFDKFVGFV